MVSRPRPDEWGELDAETVELLPLVDDTSRSWRPGWCSYPNRFGDSPDVELLCGGLNTKTHEAVGLWRQGNLLHFGFQQGPHELNGTGHELLENAIHYIARFTEDRPIARTPSIFELGHGIPRRDSIAGLLRDETYALSYLGRNFCDAERAELEELGFAGYAERFASMGPFMGLDAQDRLVVDADLVALGFGNADPGMIGAAIAALGKSETRDAGARVLERYVPGGPGPKADAAAWERWHAEHAPYLFFLETGRYVWHVDPLAEARGVPSAELRGPERADRARPGVPAYVVVERPRPWESAAFRATRLDFEVTPAEASDARPSFDADEAGLTRLERGSVLLFHSPGRAELAEEIADLVDDQHRLLAWYTRQPFKVLPFVIAGAEEELPVTFGFWVDVDGVTCWKLPTSETELPLTNEGYFWADVARSWLYHGTLHECFHHGACYRLKLMPYRWFCEGVSDYLAALAAVCYSPELDRAHVSDWIEPIEEVARERETIDVLSDDVWFAPGGGRLNSPVETAAYGASQYSIARLVSAHGYDWIASSLARFEERPPRNADDLLRVLEEETGEDGLRERLEAVPLADVLAYLRQGIP